ncbi:unnamed protein product [Miscanthus lutarioriparius]|uniref:NAC domain-containing protein n=1 Tax=Miscanthus lutarioriparius TaxID=422564 RepID=A0A811N0K3_9POAL|nr:unnamed protein product [Miscanthus lutarioriparius]
MASDLFLQLRLTAGVDKGVWFFFTAGNSKASARSGSRLRNRARTVLGVDGRKKGAWHTEGGKKPVPGTAGGYFQKMSYEEVTPSGSVVKPGWLMVEYAIEEEHGGGAMVLCKVYKSPRGPGSDVSSSRKRKAACVVEQPVVEQMQRPCKRTNEEHMFLVGNLLHKDLTATNYYTAAPAYQETEHVLGSGESAASADQCTRKTDQLPDEGQPRIQEDARDELTRFWESLATCHDETALDYPVQKDQPVAPCSPQTEDEDDVMEISFEEFKGSSSLIAVPRPCAAQPEDAAVSCIQMSEQKVLQADDGDEIEFTFEELMTGSSTPGGYSTMSSPRTLTDDDEDDDDMRGLACPPMDYAILEALMELGPAIMEEDFICDL